ncbi:hypothetical protein LSS_09049 [Leptospira santarosai serovar Shermani str. LT 821]|uniref:Uncharacterized protein n=1 Tax=Leptospira santarosai serovar Shermani str. LT 821 TaxID=758847 RepID=K8YBS7_9LEPT|nr:hypothetical protein LSS_09049 [Leptospira santarosai serovar Shermani str. LT 821]
MIRSYHKRMTSFRSDSRNRFQKLKKIESIRLLSNGNSSTNSK